MVFTYILKMEIIYAVVGDFCIRLSSAMKQRMLTTISYIDLALITYSNSLCSKPWKHGRKAIHSRLLKDCLPTTVFCCGTPAIVNNACSKKMRNEAAGPEVYYKISKPADELFC